MNSAPAASASAKMRSFMAGGVQQVWTIACEDTGAACAGLAAPSAAASRTALNSRRDIAPNRTVGSRRPAGADSSAPVLPVHLAEAALAGGLRLHSLALLDRL